MRIPENFSDREIYEGIAIARRAPLEKYPHVSMSSMDVQARLE
jgi:hypothetical protein